ncbi:MAG: glycosyltransferase family 4 protein [Phycisphaerae bacterium]
MRSARSCGADCTKSACQEAIIGLARHRETSIGSFNMRVVVAVEARFVVVEGKVYSSYLTYESFWRRYLVAFDSLLIIARASQRDHVPDGHQIVNGEGVQLAALPQYQGPREFLGRRGTIRRLIRGSLRADDACILRVPGNIGTQVWRQLPPGRPFGVEVIVDPWDEFAPGAVRHIARPFFRWLYTRNLTAQCCQAVAASYVTEFALQKRYPPSKDALTTHYSSIGLSAANICSNTTARMKAISTIPARLAGEESPVRLGFIGSFTLGHKLPDVHIRALARCVSRGANVTLDMIGEGTMLDRMRGLARELRVEDRVTFRGRLPGGQAIFDAIDTFDLFLNATAAEGLPRVVIEAMSRGCPCIASTVNGHPELLESRDLVPPGDVDALVEAILRMLSNPKAMAERVSRNIEIARNYTEEVLAPRRRLFYEALCERTQHWLARRC